MGAAARSEWQGLQQQGLEAFAKNDFPAARAAFQALAAHSGAEAYAFQGLGDVALRAGEFDDAVEMYMRSALKKPGYFRPWLGMGRTCAAAGRRADAINFLRMAALLAPENRDVSRLLAQQLLSAQDLPGLVAVAAPMHEAGDADPWVSAALVNAVSRLGDKARAANVSWDMCDRLGWPEARKKGYRFETQAWFLNNLEVFERFVAPLKDKRDARVMEVGCFEGMSACWTLDHALNKHRAQLVCIDPEFQPTFRANIKASGQSKRVDIIEAPSQEAMLRYALESFDLIYVDGLHTASQVLSDALMAWLLVKPGGCIVFDDYWKGDDSGVGQLTRYGVDVFLASHRGGYSEEHRGRQIVVSKTGEAADWRMRAAAVLRGLGYEPDLMNGDDTAAAVAASRALLADRAKPWSAAGMRAALLAVS